MVVPRSHYQTFHSIVVLLILQDGITRLLRAHVHVMHLRLCVTTTAAREMHKLILGLLNGWGCTEQWSVNCVP
jgi:hypothetical protein